jgi:peroxiredoxin
MAQLRHNYQQFVDREAEVVVVGPDDEQAFRDYWQREDLPFVGLADPTHTVARRYGQESKLHKLGRLPALMVVDKMGRVVYRHYGTSMSDIPRSDEMLAVLDELGKMESRSGQERNG